jgi:bacillithiol biosynthesis cysteine-adding enzyme BshC
MTFRIADTPLRGALAEPPRRQGGGIRPELREAFLPGAGVAGVLDKLSRAGALAVTTGQQPALLTGPLYTVHKALSAAALAAELERRWGRPVVPVFWVAGDDHDWAEARSASWIGGAGDLVTASLRERPRDAPMLPLYREPLGPEITAVLDMLAASLPASTHRDAAVDWARRHFDPARSVAAASGAAIAELVAAFGVLCFDATSRPAKRAAAPTLLAALRDADEIERSLAGRTAEIQAAGGDPGIEAAAGATLVMLDGPGGRDRLIREGERFVTRRTRLSHSLADLEAIAEREPERLSANVLLRPVVESALLPTVAYCGGPSELRYLPLAAPVFERLDVHWTMPMPRWSGVVVSAAVDRVLERFGIDLGELLDPRVDVAARAVRDQIPPEAGAALEGLRADLASRYRTVGSTAAALDPTLARPFENALTRSLDLVRRVEAKLVRNLKRRHETELRQLLRARVATLPGGRPQERVVTAASVLAPHGPAVLAATHEAASRWYAGALEGRPVPA